MTGRKFGPYSHAATAAFILTSTLPAVGASRPDVPMALLPRARRGRRIAVAIKGNHRTGVRQAGYATAHLVRHHH